MGRVSETLYGVSQLGSRAIFGPEHIQDDDPTARAEYRPHSGKSDFGLYKMMQGKPENHSIEAARMRPPLKQKPVPVARRCVGKSSGK